MTEQRRRVVPADPEEGLNPGAETGPATVPGQPDAPAPASDHDRPEFAGVAQDADIAPASDAPATTPGDAVTAATTPDSGADRLEIGPLAGEHGRALAAGDLDRALEHAVPAARDELRAQLAELQRRLARPQEVTVVRARPEGAGWTVVLQYGSAGASLDVETRWEQVDGRSLLAAVTVVAPGA